jgi:hypothetical protein
MNLLYHGPNRFIPLSSPCAGALSLARNSLVMGAVSLESFALSWANSPGVGFWYTDSTISAADLLL